MRLNLRAALIRCQVDSGSRGLFGATPSADWALLSFLHPWKLRGLSRGPHSDPIPLEAGASGRGGLPGTQRGDIPKATWRGGFRLTWSLFLTSSAIDAETLGAGLPDLINKSTGHPV